MLEQLLKRTPLFKTIQRVKDLMLEKLDRVEKRLDRIDAQQAEHSANDTSILEALVHLVQRAPADNAIAESRQAALLREIRQRADTTDERLIGYGRQILELERAFRERYDALEKSIAAGREAVLQRADLDALVVRLQREEIGLAPRLDGAPGGEDEPELALVSHLTAFIPHRVAIDVGAHAGVYSEALLKAGFAVHAFEPNPKMISQLRARLGGRPGFAAHALAVGSSDGTLSLHLLKDSTADHVYDASTLSTFTTHALPDGLTYDGALDVPVRSLEKLHADGVLPTEVGYLKVDTEGFDLEVVRGMGSHRYPLVSVEFWDSAMEFGKSGAMNALPDLVAELQGRGYSWWIVIYRVWGDTTSSVRFYCNVARSVERSWGNAFFFQDYSLFAQAERWCSAVLPRTYFAATQKKNGAQIHEAPKTTA